MRYGEAPLVLETPGGLSVQYRDRLLYSRHDPARLPLRAAEACDRGKERLHLALSPLLWYGAKELLAAIGSGSAVLFLEADPALAELARHYAPPGVLEDPRVAFIGSDSAEEILHAARALGRFRACSTIALSGGEALNAAIYRSAAAAIAAGIEASWRNRAALMILGRRWARNIIANLAALPAIDPEPFPRLTLPVALCGAGPSLEAALSFLAVNRARLSIIACDTALGSLLASGIEPDLVVCLEAQAHNLADFTPLGDRETNLVADLSSHPASFRAVRGKKRLSLVAIADSPFLDRVASLMRELGVPALEMPPLGSVGVHAARLARELTDAPILAFGLDFSFETGKTHARGCPALLAEERRMSRTRRWEGQYAVSFRDRSLPAPCPPLEDGRALLSDPILLSYAGLMGELSYAPGAPIYDARGRGPSIASRRLNMESAAALIAAWGDAATAPGCPADAATAPGCPADAATAPGCPADAAAAPGATADANPRATPAELARGVRAFLRDELARLDALYDIMKGRRPVHSAPRGADGIEGAAEKGAEADAPADLANLVTECDYLYWSFADAERALEMPQDFLNRLLPEVEWWSARIRSHLS